MAKRFTDTDKYKKAFIRGLQGPYKLLWDYLYHECDHAGIWEVEWDVMQLRLGEDMHVEYHDALAYFNKGKERVVEIQEGKKWLIVPFIEIQYGELSDDNRVHNSVILMLKKYNVYEKIKGLIRPLEGCKDKDKDKDKDNKKRKKSKWAYFDEEKFGLFWSEYPRKVGKRAARKAFASVDFSVVTIEQIIESIKLYKKTEWKNSDKKFIPHPATWLNQERYLDEIESGKKTEEKKVCVACGGPASMKIGNVWYCIGCRR